MSETNPTDIRFTDEDIKAAILKKKEKNASFFFTLAQLVFTAFVIGGLAIFFTDFTVSWRFVAMLACGLFLVVMFYWIANVFLNLKKE